MYFTYILKSLTTERLYIGYTDNLQRRIFEHNSNKSKSTRFRGPWELLFSKEFPTRSEAMKFELKLKSFKNKDYILKYISNL